MSIQILSGHTSPETAYVVNDYPYGFTLRCKIRYWLEVNMKHGVRFVSQTTNPKVAGSPWNKPKASTYYAFASMYLDDDGKVQWEGITAHAATDRIVKWREDFGAGVPERLRVLLDVLIERKTKHDQEAAKRAADGDS